MPPGWRPKDLGPSIQASEIDKLNYQKFNPVMPKYVGIYVLIQLSALGIAFPFLSLFSESVPLFKITGIAALYIWTMVNMGEMMEANKRAVWSELLRNTAMLLLLYFQFYQSTYFSALFVSSSILAVFNSLFLFVMSKKWLKSEAPSVLHKKKA